MHPAPLPLEQWKNIDAVVISHDHFDHLDMDTIRHLAQGGTHFYVGLGIGAHLERWQVPAAQIHEMDWWEQASIKGVTIHLRTGAPLLGPHQHEQLHAVGVVDGEGAHAFHVLQRRHRLCRALQGDTRASWARPSWR